MTQRERQILNWIEADPMISQQELADRAGITRSSVAVHQFDEKGLHRRQGVYCDTQPLCHRSGRHEYGHRRPAL